MGPDYFAVLQLERRPWIDSDQLKQEYQQRTFSAHPDRNKNADGGGEDFATITEAYRVLSSPRLRLQHLLLLEGDAQPSGEAAEVTSALSDVFMSAAGLVREIDAHVQNRDQTTSALGKSLLTSELANLKTRINFVLQQLETVYADATNNLRSADEKWTTDRPGTLKLLRPLVQRFAFLERWVDQLREKQFQLSS